VLAGVDEGVQQAKRSRFVRGPAEDVASESEGLNLELRKSAGSHRSDSVSWALSM
jgi:hypothetical protein